MQLLLNPGQIIWFILKGLEFACKRLLEIFGLRNIDFLLYQSVEIFKHCFFLKKDQWIYPVLAKNLQIPKQIVVDNHQINLHTKFHGNSMISHWVTLKNMTFLLFTILGNRWPILDHMTDFSSYFESSCFKLRKSSVKYSLLNRSCPRHPPQICLDYKVFKNIDIQGEERVRDERSWMMGKKGQEKLCAWIHRLPSNSQVCVTARVKREKRKKLQKEKRLPTVYDNKEKSRGDAHTLMGLVTKKN